MKQTVLLKQLEELSGIAKKRWNLDYSNGVGKTISHLGTMDVDGCVRMCALFSLKSVTGTTYKNIANTLFGREIKSSVLTSYKDKHEKNIRRNVAYKNMYMQMLQEAVDWVDELHKGLTPEPIPIVSVEPYSAIFMKSLISETSKYFSHDISMPGNTPLSADAKAMLAYYLAKEHDDIFDRQMFMKMINRDRSVFYSYMEKCEDLLEVDVNFASKYDRFKKYMNSFVSSGLISIYTMNAKSIEKMIDMARKNHKLTTDEILKEVGVC